MEKYELDELDLLHDLLEEEGIDVGEKVGIPRRQQTTAPLSHQQRRLWLFDQLHPGSAAYNLRLALKMDGELDVAGLEKALTVLCDRHEILRTTFREEDGEPRQVIAPQGQIPLTSTDWRDRDRDEIPAAIQDLARQEGNKPFDLEAGPLVRAHLVRIGERSHVFVLMLHHILADAWSLGILFTELGRLYELGMSGRPLELEPLPIQYADYAAWQVEPANHEVLTAQLAYWREQLADVPVLELPTDRPRPAEATANCAVHWLKLPAAVGAGLESLARQDGASLFMALLAGYGALLARTAGQDDLTVGSPMAGRTRPELEGLIGFFVNTMVLRLETSGNPSFRQLVARAREVCLAAFSHQEVPFDWLVEALVPERDLSHTPLFQAMLVLQNVGARASALPGLAVEPLLVEWDWAKFDLNLTVTDEPGDREAYLEYNTDLFDAATIARFADHLLVLLDAAVADPDRPLAELPWLTAAERQQLAAWNDTATLFPEAELDLGGLLLAQVERTPDALAVSCAAEALSYRGLLERADRLAARLGAPTGDHPIGVCAERSLELIEALVAVVRSGAAFVPLDPDYPRLRLAAMLEDARPRTVLIQGHLQGVLPEHGGQTLVLGARDEGASSTPKAGPRELDEVAYVLFTSGSTGRPKGAMNSHRGIVNRLMWMQSLMPLGVGDRVVQKTPISFDVAVWELFGPLVAGACLVMARPGGHRDPAYLVELAIRERVSQLHFVPSLLGPFLSEPEVARATSLRWVLSGGEALTHELVERFRDRLPTAELYNLYGPAEAAVDVTAWRVAGASERVRLPIGQPVWNTRVEILDPRLRPVPIGVRGELVVAGTQVGQGYVARPALTAERYVPDPWSTVPGARLYRSGDLARRNVLGEIEFLGRRDHQTKVRGMRIELGEIEAVLGEHEAVRRAVVLAREDRPGDRRLAAYLVVTGEVAAKPLLDDLRRFLAERLPEYMVPGAFMILDELPLLPNGKIDRAALPAPLWDVARSAWDGPRNPAEDLLCGIWAEVLGRERIGIHDNFFELGGHSLLAIQMVSRARKKLGMKLSMRKLFAAPTIAELAPRLVAAGGSSSEQPIEPVPRSDDLPLSAAQERLWFLGLLEPESPAYNMILALRFHGELDAELVRSCLDGVWRRHETLRTVFAEKDGRGVQVIRQDGGFPLELDDWRERPRDAQDEAIQARAAERLALPFDLERGPLARGELIRLAEDEHLLFLEMHHIISDGWSLGVLFRELAALYLAHHQDRALELPELAIQYADFAAWQRRPEEQERILAQRDFWVEQLADVQPISEHLFDRPRPAQPTWAGAWESFRLDTRLHGQLVRAGRAREATLFMTLLAAFAVLLERYTAEDDLAVGTPVANRDRVELENLIGFFVNTLVLRIRLDRRASFADVLDRVRETALAAYTHQDVPFEAVVEAVQPVREASRHPLFQVMFVMQNTPRAEVILPGLEIRQEELAATVAKFDLSVFVEESPSGISGILEYNTDLFDRATILTLADHYRALLESLSEDPARPIAEAALLSAGERRQLLSLAKGDATKAPPAATVLELFAAQVKERPTAPAVRAAGSELSYAELDHRARSLARQLVDAGIGRGEPVVLSGERSVELIVGLVGILQAGAAYVPLDPAWPDERLALLIRDCGASLAVVAAELVPRFSVLGPTCLSFDEDPSPRRERGEEDSGSPSPAMERGLGGEDLPTPDGDDRAYMIYTSGSTGTPKGVQVSHRNLLSSTWARYAFYRRPVGRYLLLSPVAFDSSVAGLFWALTQGGALILPSEEALRDPRALGELIAEERVTHILTLPSLYKLILDHASEVDLSSLEVAIVAGEACPRAVVEQHRRLFTNTVVTNTVTETLLCDEYGPTEATVWASADSLANDSKRDQLTIGRPIPGSQVLIFDPQLRLLPAGRPGELCAGGPGVTWGYLGRPGLTARAFVPHPFALEPGERLYRTGDLARWRPDGNLTFLGRIDAQVKLRGFRIEPGEIQSALLAHPKIAEAVVATRRDAHGDARLLAWAVPRPDETVTEGELRQFLSARLPAHMVPSTTVLLADLPRSPTGKVDVKALPDPGLRQRGKAQYVAPRDALEAQLTRIWEELLQVEPIGVDDVFFDVGGHSMLAVRLMARIRSQLGRALPLAVLFEHPTPAGLAAALRSHADGRPASLLVPLRSGTGTPLFCVHQAGGNVLEYFGLARFLGGEQACYGLQARGLDGREAPLETLEAMAAAYLEAVRQVQPEGPYQLIGHSLGGKIAFEMARQLVSEGEAVAFLAAIDVVGLLPDDEDYTPVDDAGALAHIARQIGDYYGVELGIEEGQLRWLDAEARFALVGERLATTGLAAEGMDRDDLAGMLAVYKANMVAVQAYRPPRWDGPLTVFATAELIAKHADDPTLGWGAMTGGTIDIVPIDGDHFNVLREDHAKTLAASLRRFLLSDAASDEAELVTSPP